MEWNVWLGSSTATHRFIILMHCYSDQDTAESKRVIEASLSVDQVPGPTNGMGRSGRAYDTYKPM